MMVVWDLVFSAQKRYEYGIWTHERSWHGVWE